MTPPRLLDAGRKLHARVRNFFDAAPDATASPLELLQAALDQLERKAQPSGRGSRIFPYRRIVVHVNQPAADRAAIEAVFAQLQPRLRERLTELRCEPPSTLDTRVIFDEPQPESASDAASQSASEPASKSASGAGVVLWVECSGEGDRALQQVATNDLPQLRVQVMKGQCEQPEYTLQEAGIAIGRGTEPMDTFGRIRHNHVAFLEVRDGASETVARAHARLQFDQESRSYLLFNESSSNPTFIRRHGRSLRVAPRDPRGVRIESGDELQLGRAVLKLAITFTMA
jgi:hypothetical protein